MKRSLLASSVLALALVSSAQAADTAHDGIAATNPPTGPAGDPVSSQSKHNVIAYKYHPDTQILNIRLSGGTYRFIAVPQATYDAFVAAGADTRAYLDAIDGTFKAEYVREDPAWMRAGQPKDAGL